VSLVETIKGHFDRCVISKYEGSSSKHPIIYLNSIKNIIGDDKNQPSTILLKALEKIANQYPKREDDQELLDQVAKDGIGLTVFISDLIESCENHDYKRMEKEAARLQLVSENGLSGFEILIEIALRDFNRLGLLAYHLHRAMNFNKEIVGIWHYARCIIIEIVKKKLPNYPENHDIIFDLDNNIYSNQIETLTSAHRLWNIDSIRKTGFAQKISSWLSTHESQTPPFDDDKTNGEFKVYSKNGGRFFIEIAETLIDSPNKIVELESLRYLTNNASPKHLSYISNRIMSLIK
jgi:hypothetical protein